MTEEILETVDAYCVVGNHGKDQPLDFKLRDFDVSLKQYNPLAVWLKREDIPKKKELMMYGHRITKCKIIVYKDRVIKNKETILKAQALSKTAQCFGRKPFPPKSIEN